MLLALSFLQPWMLFALPLIALPIIIHLINQWRYQSKPWGAMMFLLAANRMNRGYARLRQWLILAMRTLAIAGLIFAISRPLSSGFLGVTAGGKSDSAIVLLDRSPSMQQVGESGTSKLETGKRQLANVFETLSTDRWLSVDSAGGKTSAHESTHSLLEGPGFSATSAAANVPQMLEQALEAIVENKFGNSEVWICSDMRASDWDPENGNWNVLRERFQQLPQTVRFNLLTYDEPPEQNLSVTVSDVRQIGSGDGVDLAISFRIAQLDESTLSQVRLTIEVNGTPSEHTFELSGRITDVKDYRLPLPPGNTSGWGTVRLPNDANPADNMYYFVFSEDAQRRVLIVSEDRRATRALEIAASVGPRGEENTDVVVLAPEQLDSLVLDNTALLVWQAELPDGTAASAVEAYLDAGGQAMFFPPGPEADLSRRFRGVGWGDWAAEKAMVENWRSDADLLAATDSGTGLPVGQLEIFGHQRLNTDEPVTKLATLSGGDPLLARTQVGKGATYFFTASADPETSNLAEGGVVLFVALQRAIEQGQAVLGNASNRVAGIRSEEDRRVAEEATSRWRQLSGPAEALSSEFTRQAGIYEDSETGRLVAVNRPQEEDRVDTIDNEQLDRLFAGLQYARVDDDAGSLLGVVREIWRLFLILMIAALFVEAILCLPRTKPRTSAAGSIESARAGFDKLAAS